jgi:hypothetical protein
LITSHAPFHHRRQSHTTCISRITSNPNARCDREGIETHDCTVRLPRLNQASRSGRTFAFGCKCKARGGLFLTPAHVSIYMYPEPISELARPPPTAGSTLLLLRHGSLCRNFHVVFVAAKRVASPNMGSCLESQRYCLAPRLWFGQSPIFLPIRCRGHQDSFLYGLDDP